MKKRGMNSWIGFDLDGTLAYHEEGASVASIGDPIPSMIALVKKYLDNDQEVRIVTARVSPEWDDRDEQTAMIQDWCEKHIGVRLPVQAHKNGGMLLLYDDRAWGVVRNRGLVYGTIDHVEAAAQDIIRVFYERTGMNMDPRVAEALAHAAIFPK